MIGAHSFTGINFWAVLVSAIATMVIGFLWYSPMLFANPWMRLMGIDPNDKAKLAELQKGAGKTYGMAGAEKSVAMTLYNFAGLN